VTYKRQGALRVLAKAGVLGPDLLIRCRLNEKINYAILILRTTLVLNL
jgi:hypothetical protein